MRLKLHRRDAFSISLGRISPSVARVTGRRLAHFHILTDFQVDRTELLPAPFLYLCARLRLCICVCNQLPPHIYKKGQVCQKKLQSASLRQVRREESEGRLWKEEEKEESLYVQCCSSFLCWLIEVTILMSVTSSCHDKPLWVKPVLSLAGSLPLLHCSYSTLPSLPTQGANLTTIM